ncbi:UDP-glucose 4-epimerase GalE [Hoeflea ulvae]|uniref:UDP-glucose 4-epimerase n=1 Tax=Hoeflea ulvae TaxID=2983764 RepID=A0ABT3YKY3_9HYPH|nr:UDP-glucose 4-epimerase GalE [Hoeflea ulvae]MCY0096405.1 UDP-glucose 4-epimerase GalE [Hoeflea ulvae]
MPDTISHDPTRILVTGGAGYIGSHCCVELINEGYQPVILDDFSNAQPGVVDSIETITGKRPPVIAADIRDRAAIATALSDQRIGAVMHFAALKAVGESVRLPLAYYDVNVSGTLALLGAMQQHGLKTIVFSSSATVYGIPDSLPVREDAPRMATNPYGRSKIIAEDFLTDLFAAEPDWQIAVLRYFNPVGAHQSGLIGEDPSGIPNNLMPFVAQVASGKQPCLSIFGDDYPTRDGTGVRDFIHVVDLAKGHVAAIRHLETAPGLMTLNLGTGTGYSVLELIEAFIAASGREVPYRIEPRRQGDVAEIYADPSLAGTRIGWQATRTLEDMCRDTWNWQSRKP